ncbi:hypothetical protein NQ317_008103 [Molorchus minor]|uniref:Uncharacterized protein n=1 Tax=Molorchus minor TaxID=1323400 RepID=A0ABQ9JF94_9CUCU|nr:hypothetical protein NQ317_008103 [Molorchus minor]
MMVLHLTMPFRSVRFIFIVSPFHRKIAGREALDLFSSSLPSIEKSPVEEAPYKISLSVLGELFFNDGTMVTLLEHLSMPILVFGKCVLLKGDVTRDQRSLLLLVYTGTAADIIQFCELFRDPKVGSHNLLPIIAIFIWAFSIMQFPIVEMVTTDLRPNTIDSDIKRSEHCLIEGWTIVIHTALQDAPFLAFRILVITHIRVISYMNFFFTCKNILVILFNAHRLFAIYGEQKKDKAMNLGIFPSSSKYIQAKEIGRPTNTQALQIGLEFEDKWRKSAKMAAETDRQAENTATTLL